MKCPQDKAIGYTAVVVVCAIVLSIVVTSITGLIVAPVAMAGIGASSASSSEPQFAPDSAMGKLEALGRKLEESGAKMERAQKSGDTAAETAAAFEGLGTLLGGGKRVEPVAIDQLRPLVPNQFAGLARQSGNAERNGIAGIMVPKRRPRMATAPDTLRRSRSPTRAARQDYWEWRRGRLFRASARTTRCRSGPSA